MRFTTTIPALACAFALILAVPTNGAALRSGADTPPGLAADARVQEALALLLAWVEAERAYQRIPGISLAVVHDQDLLLARGFGYADQAAQRPAAADTIYSICSISKLFTAVAVLRLRDQGKLRLDDPIDRLLPGYDLSQAHSDSPPVTVGALLSHSSGLPRESNHPYWTGPAFPFPTRAEVLDGLDQQRTLYPADRRFQYSNLGITLAGEIVAAASGVPYERYVESEILAPLGLADTRPFLPEAERDRRFATGYSPWRRAGERTPMPFFQARGIAAAAGFSSTALDLARFASWQLRLLERGGREVLDANTLREMQRVHFVDPSWQVTWGLGFEVSRNGDGTLVGHGGACPGFRTELALDPQTRIAVVFMSNAMGVDTTHFVTKAHALVAPALEAASGKEPAPAVDPDIARYAGRYESAWGESVFFLWQGGLATLSLPARDPLGGIEKLQHQDGTTFKRKRKDGSLAEELRFELDAAGRVLRVWQHGNAAERVADLR